VWDTRPGPLQSEGIVQPNRLEREAKNRGLLRTSRHFAALRDSIEGPKFAVSRESIRLFCDTSLDYNPLHLDDDYMPAG
jgi:acyl dehydratase